MRAAIAILVVVVGAFVIAGSDLPDPDIWWNTADGLYRLDHHEAPPLAFYGAHGCDDDVLDLVSGAPTIAIAAAYRAFDMWGLVALRALLVAVVGLCVLVARRRDPDRVLTLLLALIAMGTLAIRASARPELFAVALLACTSTWLVSFITPRPLSAAPGLLFGAALAWTHPLGLAALLVAFVVAGARFVHGEREGAKAAAWAAIALAIGLCARPAIWLAPVDIVVEGRIAHALRFREYMPLPALFAEGYNHPWLACAALLVVATLASTSSVARTIGAVLAVVAAVDAFVAIRGLVLFAAFAPAIGAGVALARRTRAAVVAGFAVALAVVAFERVDDPVVHGQAPPDLTPTRLQPLGPARFLEDKRGLVFAPLHASNWILLHDRDVHVVWSGRRTYSLTCGLALLHAREGVGFGDVDARLHPDFVVVDLQQEHTLTDVLVTHRFRLVYVDLFWAVFARPATETAETASQAPKPQLDASAEHVVDGTNRPIDAPTLAAKLDRVCALLRSAAPDQANDVCAAVAHMRGNTP